MATAIENTGDAISRWQVAIDQASRGISVGCYSCRLGGVAQEISLSSRVGRWMRAVSAVADGDLDQSCLLVSYLRAARGELDLGSPFGRWALAVSQRFCGGRPGH